MMYCVGGGLGNVLLVLFKYEFLLFLLRLVFGLVFGWAFEFGYTKFSFFFELNF